MNSVLPAHSGPIERALETAFSKHSERYQLPALWSPEKCPIALLPFLADAVSVDRWDEGWAEETKRSVVAASIAVHSRKGTLGSVSKALGAIGFSLEIVEWFQDGGAPFTFTVIAAADDLFSNGYQIDNRLIEAVTGAINDVKPARAHFGVRVGERFETKISVRFGTRTRRVSRLTHDVQGRPT